MNEDLRKRCKYLAHLAEGADVVFVEADLEGVVGVEGLKPFEAPQKMRRARRKDKGKKDDKARARAEEREREKLALPLAMAQSWTDHIGADISHHIVIPDIDRSPSPTPHECSDPQGPAVPRPQQQTSGAWGARSFASAAHSARARPAGQALRNEEEDVELDLDAAFHELEQRGSRGGGKKRNNRMVVLGIGSEASGRRRELFTTVSPSSYDLEHTHTYTHHTRHTHIHGDFPSFARSHNDHCSAPGRSLVRSFALYHITNQLFYVIISIQEIHICVASIAVENQIDTRHTYT